MSQYPYDPSMQSPVPYGATPPKPAAVTAVSILAIIWASLGLLCGVFGTISMLGAVASGRIGAANGRSQVVHHDVGQVATLYQEIGPIMVLALSIVLLTIGIGGLSLRPWARRMAMPWAVIQIIWACISVYCAMNLMDATMANTPRRQLSPEAMKISFMFGAAGVALLNCIIPACFLILWNRPNVKAAFEGQVGNPS